MKSGRSASRRHQYTPAPWTRRLGLNWRNIAITLKIPNRAGPLYDNGMASVGGDMAGTIGMITE